MAEKKTQGKKEKKGRTGQRSKYDEWIKPEGLLLIKGWKMDGLTDEEVAKNIGINRTTLYDWKNRFPDIANALKMSAEVADRIIENALFEKAKAGSVPCIIFYLKNRKPDVWRELKDTSLDTTIKELQADKLREEIEKLKRSNTDLETPMLNQVESVLVKIKKVAEEEASKESEDDRTDTKAD